MYTLLYSIIRSIHSTLAQNSRYRSMKFGKLKCISFYLLITQKTYCPAQSHVSTEITKKIHCTNSQYWAVRCILPLWVWVFVFSTLHYT